MSAPVVTKDPAAVAAEVEARYLAMFPDGDLQFVPRVFGWATDCFTGRYADYQAVDARYHDFEHTLQGTLCLTRLLHGWHRAAVHPALPMRLFELGLLAILLHDTGYLKRAGDPGGTGAKYTVTHVRRSAEFAARLMAERGFAPAEILAVQNMIRCTGVDAELGQIPFQSDVERKVGFALATADWLGQMAAEDYLEKLPALYAEFAEAARHDADSTAFVASFASAEDLIRRTPLFWEKFVRRKLEWTFGGLHRFLNDPYPDGPNEYVARIEAHMVVLRRRLGLTDSSLSAPERRHAQPGTSGPSIRASGRRDAPSSGAGNRSRRAK